MNGLLAYILSKKYVDKKVEAMPTAFRPKPPVNSFDSLPLTSNVEGDVRETLDDGHEYYWTVDDDGVGHWNRFTGQIHVDNEFSDLSENPVQNRVIKQELDKKAVRDEDAVMENVAIFDNNGNAVDSGKIIMESSDNSTPNDDSLPTTAWVDTMKQDKGVVVSTSNVEQHEGVSVPVITKEQFQLLYNAVIAGRTGLIIDSTNEYYYFVGYARHKEINGSVELRISINVHNILFIDYVYKEESDTLTINSTYQTVTHTDKLSWDAKMDAESITKTTESSVTLVNHDTVVFSQQMSGITVDIDVTSDEDDTDFITGFIVKPYDNFVFQYNDPEDFVIVWQDGVPTFQSGHIYEVIFRVLWIENDAGNIIISGKWSMVA